MGPGMFDGVFEGIIIACILFGIAVAVVAILLWKYVLCHISFVWN